MTDNDPIDHTEEPIEHTEENYQPALQPVGNLTILSNVFMAPQVGMVQVQQRYNVIFPLFTLIVLSSLAIYTYFSLVDYAWYVDYMVEITAGDLSKSEQDTTRAAMSMLSQSATGSIAATVLLILTPIVFVIQALYFVIVSNINNDGYQFKQWFSFIAWSSVPALISVIAMFAILLTSSNLQMPFDSLNPLSLNELIFGLEPSQGLGKLLSTIHLGQIWSFVVMIIGYQAWTKKSIESSIAIVLAPYVAWYVGWFFFI